MHAGIQEPIQGGVEAGLRIGLGKQQQDDHYTNAENVQRKQMESELQVNEAEDRTKRREVGQAVRSAVGICTARANCPAAASTQAHDGAAMSTEKLVVCLSSMCCNVIMCRTALECMHVTSVSASTHDCALKCLCDACMHTCLSMPGQNWS